MPVLVVQLRIGYKGNFSNVTKCQQNFSSEQRGTLVSVPTRKGAQSHNIQKSICLSWAQHRQLEVGTNKNELLRRSLLLFQRNQEIIEFAPNCKVKIVKDIHIPIKPAYKQSKDKHQCNWETLFLKKSMGRRNLKVLRTIYIQNKNEPVISSNRSKLWIWTNSNKFTIKALL